MRAPRFWSRPPGLAAAALAPLAAVYGAVTARRMARSGLEPPAPLLCVGNFTVGGTGKTPTAIALGRLALEQDLAVVYLTRGYGGRLAGPLVVDLATHEASEVGDEALLLARVAPTVVARDRAAALPLLAGLRPGLIVMDDGLQNPVLRKDLSLAVVDGEAGFGNCLVVPAGPLRAPLARQAGHVDALLVIGAGEGVHAAERLARTRAIPVLGGRLVARATAERPGRAVLAFAGIGRPEKFFAQLARDGIEVARTVAFGDHQPLSEADARRLLLEAEREGLTLVTTEKDAARLPRDSRGPLAELAREALAYGVELRFVDTGAARALIAAAVAAQGGARRRRPADSR